MKTVVLNIEVLASSVPRYMRPGFADVEPISTYSPRPRSIQYDRGRVAYFRNVYQSGAWIDNLDVFLVGDQYVLADGHHRLAGALWAGVQTVRCNIIQPLRSAA